MKTEFLCLVAIGHKIVCVFYLSFKEPEFFSPITLPSIVLSSLIHTSFKKIRKGKKGREKERKREREKRIELKEEKKNLFPLTLALPITRIQSHAAVGSILP